VGTVDISGASLKTIAAWADEGEDLQLVTLYERRVSYVDDWADGDVVATQGDAYIHVDVHGLVKEIVPVDPFHPQPATA
jgi:hypothetical protein